MATTDGTSLSGQHVVFVTRSPTVHEMSGSTTYALNLLEMLARQGAEVTMVVTLSYSRSPRPWFRVAMPLPAGVRMIAPGFLRVGKVYLDPFRLKAWARLVCRIPVGWKTLRLLPRLAQWMYRDRLFCEAWDLTPPADSECVAALRAIGKLKASTVIVNYAFWAPLFDRLQAERRQEKARMPRRVILMHDLLSARVSGFLKQGIPLDCPPISRETELGWLDRADCVLAAQAREAELIQPLLRTQVLVQPIAFQTQSASAPGGHAPIDPRRCLFVGSNIAPNSIGLAWFLDKVWPMVRAENPAAKLAVVGTVCETLPEDFEQAGIEKMGVVASIEEEYAKAAVCVVPLIMGSGIKIKLVEALSFGKATVSTSVGVQGLEDWAPGAVEVADDPRSFALAVLRLLDDRGFRRQREQAALALSQLHYNTDGGLPVDFLEAVLG